jgi:hypothetical protein
MNKVIGLSVGILLLTSTMAQQKPEHNAVWSVAIGSFTSSVGRCSMSLYAVRRSSSPD